MTALPPPWHSKRSASETENLFSIAWNVSYSDKDNAAENVY